MPSLLQTLTAPVKNLLTNRREKLARRAELLRQLEEMRQIGKAEIERQRREQEEMQKVLDGVYVRNALKDAARKEQPLTAEIAELNRYLAANVPEPGTRLQFELRHALEETAQLATFQEILKRDQTTEPLRVSKWSPASISAVREALEAKLRSLADLLVRDLTEKELNAAIEKLRVQPLPQLEREIFARDNATLPWKLVA